MSTLRRFVLVLFTFLRILPGEGFLSSIRQSAKADLLQLIKSGADDAAILSSVRKCEALSPLSTRLSGAISDPLLSDNWLMVYTTSSSIAGKTRPAYLQTRTPPEQLIDVENGRALNAETVLGITNAVEISLAPKTRSKAAMQFERFKIGPFAFAAPKGLSGELDTTYLDSEMRISRGDLGNIFVLLRESTEREAADATWAGWRESWS